MQRQHALLAYFHWLQQPTRSRGMRRSSEPCFKNTLPAVWEGLMPTPSAQA